MHQDTENRACRPGPSATPTSSVLTPPAAVTDEHVSSREARLLRSLLQSLDFPLYVIDANTREIVLANAAMCRNAPPWGVTCYALTHNRTSPCDGHDGPCPLEVVRRTKRPTMVEHRHRDEEGNVRYFEVHAVPVFDEDGRLSEMIEYNVDITHRHQGFGSSPQDHVIDLATERWRRQGGPA